MVASLIGSNVVLRKGPPEIARAVLAALRKVAGVAAVVDEVVCPNCGHTIRARMSDRQSAATPTELTSTCEYGYDEPHDHGMYGNNRCPGTPRPEQT